MTEKTTDWNARAWTSDINSFEFYKKLLATAKAKSLRIRLINNMENIKAKYPSHLKDEIIPFE